MDSSRTDRRAPGAARYLAVAILPAALVLGIGSGGMSIEPGTPDAERVVRDLLEAAEAGNTERAMSLLAPGFVVRSWNGDVLMDRAGYRRALGWDHAVGSDREVTRLRVAGDTVTVRLLERNDLTEMLGLGPFRIETRYLVNGDRISEQRMRERVDEGNVSGTERFSRAMEPILAWARQRAPELLTAATEGGSITYDADSARALLALVRRYGDEVEDGP